MKRWWPTIRFLLCLIVAGVFIGAGVLKIIDPEALATDIKHYRILPLWAVNAFAILLPWWEVAAALALFIPRWRRSGALIIGGLTVVFTVAIVSAMARGLDISCGCFGSHSTKAGIWTLARNISLLIAISGILLTGQEETEKQNTLTEAH